MLAQWQLLRLRFQKAIAEGASTSQVTAISVLASIYLQAVIAASMEEVELFLAPLTARSKVREVLRGLVATRQVHTISLGHAPLYYVAGTLPEFAAPPTIYASASIPASAYFMRSRDYDEEPPEPAVQKQASPAAPAQAAPQSPPKSMRPAAPRASQPRAGNPPLPGRTSAARPLTPGIASQRNPPPAGRPVRHCGLCFGAAAPTAERRLAHSNGASARPGSSKVSRARLGISAMASQRKPRSNGLKDRRASPAQTPAMAARQIRGRR